MVPLQAEVTPPKAMLHTKVTMVLPIVTCEICYVQYMGQTREDLLTDPKNTRDVKNKDLDTVTGRHFTLLNHANEPSCHPS